MNRKGDILRTIKNRVQRKDYKLSEAAAAALLLTGPRT